MLLSNIVGPSNIFYAPASIDRGIQLLVHPFVCLSAKSFTLAISFDWLELGPPYFTWVYLVTRPFIWYHVQGHLSRFNIKVKIFKKWLLRGHWYFTNTSCYEIGHMIVLPVPPRMMKYAGVRWLSYSVTLNPLPHIDNFWRTGGKSLLKTLWEKKKMLVISIFFFSRNVFYRMKDNFNILTHYHTMPHFDTLKIYGCGKHCEKRRNCL